jgi:RNA recognition motif-containing protein
VRILIGNLPVDVTEEELAESLRKVAPVGRVTLVREGDADDPLAVIEIALSREDADALARRIDGLIHEGKPLTAWVALRG